MTTTTAANLVEMEATRAQYEAITRTILESLERGTVPWRKPWSIGGILPYNAISGRPYRGLNVLTLATVGGAKGYSDPRWLTYKQAQEKGGTVRAGEKSTLVYFWKVEVEETDEVDDKGKPIDRKRFLLRLYYVFNVQQCDGLKLKPLTVIEHKPIEEAEHIMSGYLARSGPNLAHTPEPRAYYQEETDRIHMPLKSMFSSSEAYYATLFHEASHSTGHSSRLDRFPPETETPPFGSPNYSKEELAAEFGAAYLCGQVSCTPSEVENSAAYIASWLRALKQDPGLLVTAASQGQAAANFILGDIAEAAPSVEEEVAVAQTQLQQDVNLAQLGPTYWAKFHALAAEFKKAVGDSCGCGDHAVAAMQGWHDAVNVHLGKAPQHPEQLVALAQFAVTAAAQVDSLTVERAVSYLRRIGQEVIGPLTEEPKYRVLLSDAEHQVSLPMSSETIVQRARIYRVLEIDGMGQRRKLKAFPYPVGALDDEEDEDDDSVGETIRRGGRGHTRRKARVSNEFLRALANGFAGTVGGLGAMRLFSPEATIATSPEAAIRVVDDRKHEDKKSSTSMVYSPSMVEGDQAQVDVGSLLQEIEAILGDSSKQGLVDPESQRVVREGA